MSNRTMKTTDLMTETNSIYPGEQIRVGLQTLSGEEQLTDIEESFVELEVETSAFEPIYE